MSSQIRSLFKGRTVICSFFTMSGLLLLCVSLLVAPSWAQEVTQSISGTVTDSSGRFISGAKVTVTNLGTGLERSAVVNSDGNYEVLNLPLGQYRVVAQATGFGQSVVSRLNLAVGLNAKISIQLQVGKVTEEIKVTSTMPLVETTSGTVAGTVSETQMDQLPLNSRTFTTFTTMQPGVSVFTSSAPSNNATAAQQHQGTVIVSQGQRPGSVAFIEDGVDISDSTSAGVPGTGGGDMLGGDAIAEFQVQTHNYKAEFGQDAGAVISYVTKGGTNGLHGDVYDYLRNDVLDARNFFDPSQRPPFRRNQFGASVGGPIKRDRTFFFVNYEGLRQSLTSTQLNFVPDQTIRAAAAGTGIISDPAAIAAIGLNKPDPFGLPLPGYNASLNTFTIAPAMIPYLSLYPAPQQELGSGVALSRVPDLEPIDQNFFVAKVNQHFSDADTLMGRYQYMGNHNNFNTGTSAFSYADVNRFQNAVLSEVHVFSPKVVNNVHFGVNRTKTLVTVTANVPFDQSLLFAPGREPGVITVSGTGGGLTASSGAFSALGGDSNSPLGIFATTFQGDDSVTWVKGKHTFQFGGLIKRYQLNDLGKGEDVPGAYTFYTAASLLAADPQLYLIETNAFHPRGMRQTFFAWYAQDDFRVTPRLTLNLGLRYEPWTMVKEAHGRQSNLPDPNATQITIGNSLFKNYTLHQFEPRFGFAYDVLGNAKVVVRGGAGIFYNYTPLEDLRTELYVNPPGSVSNTFIEALAPTPASCGGPQPGLYLAFPHCPDALLVPAAVAANPANGSFFLIWGNPIHAPQTQSWNLRAETSITSNLVFTAGYVGSHTIHLPVLTEDSQNGHVTLSNGAPCWVSPASPLCPGTVTRVLTNRPGAILFHTPFIGTSNYNATEVGLKERWSHNLEFGASFVWSHTIDLSDDEFAGNVQAASASTTNQFNIPSDYGSAAFDIRKRFVLNFVYDLPFGQGRLIGGTASGALQKLAGGWSVSGIATAQSGPPFSVLAGQNFSGSGNVLPFDRPSLNPNFQGNMLPHTASQWYNPAAFVPATAGTQGNVGRNALQAPGLTNVDFSVMKTTVIAERLRAQFVAQFFNIVNHTNLGFPQNNLFNPDGSILPTAGQITSTTTNSRQIQFGLKLLF